MNFSGGYRTFPRIGKLRAWEIDRNGKIPKSAQGRVQKVFWTQGAKVSKKSFAPPKTAFAPVQNGVLGGAKDFLETFAPWVQKTFCILP